MTPRQLAEFAREHLSAIRHKSGEVLYSGVDSLQPGRVYLLGHNPGGDPTNRRLSTVGKSIAWLPKRTTNSYLVTEWSGRDTLKSRVLWLLTALKLNPRQVAASNLCFVRSPNAGTSRMQEYADLCWPVHEQILKIVRPRLVIVYGNSAQSPYSFLSQKFEAQTHKCHRSGHGSWMCRTFVVSGRFRVVGLPHLSRYDITDHCDVVRWIRALPQRL
jgi:hypothetical protein